MQSLLTRSRPDLWRRALALATNLTGYTYAPKLPGSDGTFHACGGAPEVPPPEGTKRIINIWDPDDPDNDQYGRADREHIYQNGRWVRQPYKPKTPEQVEEERRVIIRRKIADIDEHIKRREIDSEELGQRREALKKQIDELNQRKKDLERSLTASSRVYVPEGAVEWLLHEVGHWIAATPAERAIPNYGLVDDVAGVVDGFQKIVLPPAGAHVAEREWQAWAFEEIVLAPFGSARLFAPPSQRDGVVFSKAGPMPEFALRHAERNMHGLGVDVQEWRVLYGEWIRWERSCPVPSWRRVS